MECPYCKTQNIASEIRCTFCEADLTKNRPTPRNIVVFKTGEKYNDLIQYHTYDLLLLLRQVRKARTDAYKFLYEVNKLSNSIKIDSETKSFTEADYKLYTAYQNLIQEIIRDRVGYIPKRIDDKLLTRWQGLIHSQQNA